MQRASSPCISTGPQRLRADPDGWRNGEVKMAVINTEASVRERYARAATMVEATLCCPVEYDRDLLEVIPPEVIEKDYGCGDPSRYLKPGETVLDLGSG